MKRKIVYIALAVILLLIVAIIGGTVGGILGSRTDSGSSTAEIAIETTSLDPSSTYVIPCSKEENNN